VTRLKTLRPADFAVMTTTAVLLNVRHDLATPPDQHPMMAPGPVRVVHRGDVLAQPETHSRSNNMRRRAGRERSPTLAEAPSPPGDVISGEHPRHSRSPTVAAETAALEPDMAGQPRRTGRATEALQRQGICSFMISVSLSKTV